MRADLRREKGPSVLSCGFAQCLGVSHFKAGAGSKKVRVVADSKWGAYESKAAAVLL